MFRRLFLRLCASAVTLASAASAEQPLGSRINPTRGAVERVESTDEAAARQVMRTYAGCVARARRRFAETALALPYLGSEQNAFIRRGIGGIDDCMGHSGLELRFRVPSMVGGMAEQMIATRFARASLEPIALLADADLESRGLAPRNGYEVIALCVLRRDPSAVRAFVLTRPAAPEERTTGRRLVPHLGPCIDAGQTVTLDMPGLRAMLAPALYRALVAIAPPEGQN